MGKKKTPAALGALAAALSLLLICCCVSLLGTARSGGGHIPVLSTGAGIKGGFDLEVLDAATGLPVTDAFVVAPLMGESFRTGNDGRTGSVAVSVVPDEKWAKACPQGYGTVDLIVYADGYAPYVLLGLRVQPGEVRNGPVVMLVDEAISPAPIVVTDTPDAQWTQQLTERFRPQ